MGPVMPALGVALALLATTPVRAASLLCLIPGGQRVAPQMDADIVDIEGLVDTGSLFSPDWKAWRMKGLMISVFRSPKATLSWQGTVVTLSRPEPYGSLPLLYALSIDTMSGAAEFEMLDPGRHAMMRWTGRCDPVA
jgi:hypothetical protein